MGNISITQQYQGENARRSHDLEWEKESQQIGNAVSRQEAIQRLSEIDERLFYHHPHSWESKGFKERTLATYFGEITIRRRLYIDAKGGYRYLLDEYLDLPPRQLATSNLQEALVELATQTQFRQVSRTFEKLTGGVLSSSSIYRLLRKTANRAIEKEKADWQGLYERGEIPSGEDKKVPILFSEGDGVFVHLQQEEQKHYEVKQAIAYEGWEKISGKEERYKLIGKRVYCQANEKIPFWEGASLEWAKVWDLSSLKEIVIGGDGAKWIDSGIGEFSGSIRQLDGFHLARACGRGWQEGKELYEAIRAGETEAARQLMHSLIPREGTGVEQARRYVKRNLETGRDWRTVAKIEGVESRGLGTMESNEDKLIANRMKKRGLSWTIGGAHRMNKAIQLAANEDIKPFCKRQKSGKKERKLIIPALSKWRSDGHQKWLEASVPALTGPHASRPWVDKLHNLIYRSFPLN